MSKFLEELKKAVETGKINSEAANKINEIDKLAETKSINLDKTPESIEKGLGELKSIKPTDPISQDEFEESRKRYEENMIFIKQEDYINSSLKGLMKTENLIYDNIGNLFVHIENIEKNTKDFSKIEGYDKLFKYIGELKKSFNKFINH